MRKLQTSDIYLLSEIIDKLDIDPDELKLPEGTTKETETAAQNNIGIKLMFLIAKKAYKAKDAINQLLAEVTEKSVAEIEKAPFGETFNLLKEILSQEEAISFFKSKLKSE
jgi:hypothetical protein